MSSKVNNNQMDHHDDNHFFQISDEELDDCEDLDDDCLLDEVDSSSLRNDAVPCNVASNVRGPYERAWSTEATRALIHIRGPMEERFNAGRQKRTALWLHCTRQLQKMGFRYSAAKVQKKWHNILITYNKNLTKKYVTGFVHWEFFEEMYRYLQGKKADMQPMQPHSSSLLEPKQQTHQQSHQQHQQHQQSNQFILQPHVQYDSKSNDEFDEDSATTMSELKQPKIEYDADAEVDAANLPLEIMHAANGYGPTIASATSSSNQPSQIQIQNDNRQDISGDFRSQSIGRHHHIGPASGGGDGDVGDGGDGGDSAQAGGHNEWWKEHFEKKLQMEREKMQLQKELHREEMQMQKMALLQQEQIERIKIDAINNLTNALQKLVEVKNNKKS